MMGNTNEETNNWEENLTRSGSTIYSNGFTIHVFGGNGENESVRESRRSSSVTP